MPAPLDLPLAFEPASRTKELPPLAAAADAGAALAYALETCDARQVTGSVLVVLLTLLQDNPMYASLGLPNDESALSELAGGDGAQHDILLADGNPPRLSSQEGR